MNWAYLESKVILKKFVTSKNKIRSRKAVAPVIATILLVMIAVVGGSLVFAFSEGHNSRLGLNNSYPSIFLEITGFDARDVSVLKLHDGLKVDNSVSPGNFDGQKNNGLLEGERIAIYVKNNSVSKVYLDEIRLGGTNYIFVPGGTLTAYDTAFMNPGEFVIATKGTTGVANISSSGQAELQSGQEVTFLMKLDSNLQITRDTQFKISTTNGASFVGTILLGQNTG